MPQKINTFFEKDQESKKPTFGQKSVFKKIIYYNRQS